MYTHFGFANRLECKLFYIQYLCSQLKRVAVKTWRILPCSCLALLLTQHYKIPPRKTFVQYVCFTQCSRDLWHESLEESKHKRGGGKAKEEERTWKGTKALRPTQQSWAVKSTAASRRTPTSYITALHLHTVQRAEIITSHKLSMRPPNRSIARLYLPLLTLALLIELFRDVMISHPIKTRQWETLTFLNPTDG